MTKTASGTLDGRPVELRTVGIGVALEANRQRDLAGGDNMIAGFVVLAASAYWQDTGERVFRDVDAVKEWPMADLGDVMALARAAGELNRPRVDDDVEAVAQATNGTGEPRPSP